MRTFSLTYRLGLLAVAFASAGGCCAQLYCLPDDCASAISEFDFSRFIPRVTDGELPCSNFQLGCDAMVESSSVRLTDPLPPQPRIERGPPPVAYRPPMPPKFLPVPTHSIFTNVNMAAPPATRGAVEVGFGPQLASPGRD